MYQVVDEKATFKADQFAKAMSAIVAKPSGGKGGERGGKGRGGPRTMQAMEVQELPLSPENKPKPTMLSITVPRNGKPGGPLQIQLPDGRTARITLPRTAKPGHRITIKV